MGPLDSCASCASGGAVRAISPDLGESCISEMAQSHVCIICDCGKHPKRGIDFFLLKSLVAAPSAPSTAGAPLR